MSRLTPSPTPRPRSGAAEEDLNRQALDHAAGMSADRLRGRQSLRARLDARARAAEALGDSVGRQYQGAFEMLLSPAVRQAFDLRREPGAVRDRYGRT